jgi:hypothetical protein
MLETKIEALTQAVIALTEVILKIEAKETAEPTLAPVVTTPAPVVNCAPASPVMPAAPAPVVTTPAMPAAPTFEPLVEAPVGAKAPFTDGKGLIEYVMSAYKEMGAEKGAKIQGVLTELGLQNVNELRPTEYDAFYTKVEELK